MLSIEERSAVECLGHVAAEWDALAERVGSVFLTSSWFRWWALAFRPATRCILVRDATGTLRAGACFVPLRPDGMAAAANVHSCEWNVVAADAESRAAAWRHVVDESRPARVKIRGLADVAEGAEVARSVLVGSGYALRERSAVENPVLHLPSDWNQVIRSASRNLRSQLGRRRRGLSGRGELVLRTSRPDQVHRDLETFLRLEASGWKGRAGTAIVMDAATSRLYRGFAAEAALRGWLRLQLLEVDGQAVAGDLSCQFAERLFMIKTAYDEYLRSEAPGLVLRGEAIRAAVDGGAREYHFLGAAEPYKLRWGAVPHAYVEFAAYRGALGAVLRNSDQSLRPAASKIVRRSRWCLVR